MEHMLPHVETDTLSHQRQDTPALAAAVTETTEQQN